MARNIERDEREAMRRKMQLIQVGFELFSSRGIENVSMQTVADQADVGAATMYNYFKAKTNLVIAISGYIWKSVWEEDSSNVGLDGLANMDAYQLIRHYTDLILRLYQTRPEILRFSGNYKTFICRQNIQNDALHEHLDPLKPIQMLFHQAYQRAKTDHSIRTDVSEEVMFTSVAIGMLAMAERYAQGIVWTGHGETNHTQELQILRDMILTWCTEGVTYLPEAGK